METKKHKLIYWIFTSWLALGMLSTGIVQLLKLEQEVDRTVTHLGFPPYILILLGFAKIAGVLVILVPKFPLLKEWAYAGFFFMMSGAIFSHLSSGHGLGDIFPSLLLLLLTLISWYFRPINRKLIKFELAAK